VSSWGRATGLQGRRVSSSAHASAELLGGGSALGSVALFENLTGRRVGCTEELREFSVRQTSVTVGVDSADNGEELALSGVVATAAEEGAQVEGVDVAIVVLVHGSVRSVSTEVVAHFEISLQDVLSSLQRDFLLDDVENGELDISWETIVAANAAGRTIKGDVPEDVVLTWEEHLQETIGRKSD